MMVPKVVVFDLGKVLVDFDYMKVARAVSARGTVSPEEALQVVHLSPLLPRYEMGLITREQFYAEVRGQTGYGGPIDEFAVDFADIFEPMTPMIELHAALREAGVPTFIFSNTNDLAVGHIQRSYPFFSLFDGYIYSFEHGAAKPHDALYEVVERLTGRSGADILYIDDRAENIATGEKRGWRVILQETPEKTRAAVRAAGLIG